MSRRPVAGIRWPVRRVAVSAGHELFPSSEAALAETIRDRLERRIEIRQQHALGRSWCPYAVESTRLNRSIEAGVDDIKFLYPVLDNIPVVVLPLLNYACAGVRLSLYGSPEICRVGAVVRNYLLEIGLLNDPEDFVTVEEDRDAISFFNSFRRSTEPFAAGPNDAIVWTAGDLMLAYDVWPWLLEADIDDHDLIVNMIARELVFPEGTEEVVRLEYFDSLVPIGSSRAREVRQPDVLVFTGNGRQGLANLERIRGQPEAALLGIFLRLTWRGLFGGKAGSVLRAIGYGIRRKRYSLVPGHGLNQRYASDFASVFFGVPTAVKGDGADPFIIKDGDGFEEVFGYYRTLLQGVVASAESRQAGYAKLTHYYPHAEHLYHLSERLRPLWSEIELWRRWTEFIRDKTATYNRRLAIAFEEAGVPCEKPPVAEYFDASGAFQFHPSPPHSKLEGSLDYLRRHYRPRFEQGRRRYAEAVGRAE